MVYVFFTGDVKLTSPIAEEDYIKKILRRIGFTKEYKRDSFYDDSINSFSDIRMFTEKYI